MAKKKAQVADVKVEEIATNVADLAPPPPVEKPDNEAELVRLETVWRKSGRAAAEAIREIRERKLYRHVRGHEGYYKSFDDYCEERLGHTRQWVSQQVNRLRVAELMEEKGGKDAYHWFTTDSAQTFASMDGDDMYDAVTACLGMHVQEVKEKKEREWQIGVDGPIPKSVAERVAEWINMRRDFDPLVTLVEFDALRVAECWARNAALGLGDEWIDDQKPESHRRQRLYENHKAVEAKIAEGFAPADAIVAVATEKAVYPVREYLLARFRGQELQTVCARIALVRHDQRRAKRLAEEEKEAIAERERLAANLLPEKVAAKAAQEQEREEQREERKREREERHEARHTDKEIFDEDVAYSIANEFYTDSQPAAILYDTNLALALLIEWSANEHCNEGFANENFLAEFQRFEGLVVQIFNLHNQSSKVATVLRPEYTKTEAESNVASK